MVLFYVATMDHSISATHICEGIVGLRHTCGPPFLATSAMQWRIENLQLL